ncbi:MAG TPA: TatD family hydrolase [Anaerolineaceae bacterium]|nr:TatD family hydrolase [Anaerolineaceae bacterium]
MSGKDNQNHYCDTHCHLDMPAFSEDFDAVLQRALNAGLEFIIIPALDCATAENALALARQKPGFFHVAVGIHPNYAAEVDPACLLQLASLAKQPGVVAIGEIGLDYHWNYSTPAQQKAVLLPQLKLARELNLPLVIHNRDAAEDLGPILLDWQASLPSAHPIKNRPGVMHSYTGPQELAQELAEVGFYFGIGGPVTYKNGKDKQALAALLPKEQILLETDSPYLPPHLHRGERNEPAFIPLIAAKVGEIWGMSAEEVGRATTANARRLFGIP